MVGFVEALKRQSGAKNVIIDFKNGTAEVAWKKGARFDYQAIQKTVNKSAELTFRSLTLTARGEVAEHEGKPALKVTETNERFLLIAEDQAKGGNESPLADLLAAARSGGKVVTVTGRVQDPPKGQITTQPLTLNVERLARDVQPGSKT